MIGELYSALISTQWAIYEPMLEWMSAVAAGVTRSPYTSSFIETSRSYETLAEASSRRKLPKVEGGVAVIPLHGVISQRSSIFQAIFGGTSTQGFGASFQRAIADSKVGAVIIDVDSPGGTVAGVEELADIISAGSQQKTVAAVSNSQMASAAYWLASQVGSGQKRLVAAPGSEVGSIGVFRVHEDFSEMLAADGVKVTFLAVPKYKTEANPYEPLTDEAVSHHMGQVEATYESFVSAVSRGRGVPAGQVKRGFGEGRMFDARQAAAMGMVDRVATLSQLLKETGATAGGLSVAESLVLQDELCHCYVSGDYLAPPTTPSITNSNLAKKELHKQRIEMLRKLA
jgi:signal peptide peptidase SppA